MVNYLLTWMPEYINNKARLIELRIRNFIDEHGLGWVYVDWSGGKDSSLVLASALNCCRDKIVATFIHLAGQTVTDNVTTVLEIAKRYGLAIYKYTRLRHPRQLQSILYRDKPWENTPSLIYIVSTAYGLDYWKATLKYGFEAPLERFGKGKRWACAHMKNEWLANRPTNGKWKGKPARFLVVGIRREESRYRAKTWSDTLVKPFGLTYHEYPDIALAPIIDVKEVEVWKLLEYYGIHDVIKKQYDKWGRAPNCVLCPLMKKEEFKKAIRNLPQGYLERVKNTLLQVRQKYNNNLFSAKKIDEWLMLLKIRGVVE